MVLEYLEGGTLAGFMGSQGGPLPCDLIVRLVSQVASALHELHKRDIVHRDVKPDNIFLITRETDERFPILLDLGVASFGAGLSDGPRTHRGAVIGTPCAMAPEQLLGEAVGPRSDVYALGVLLYEMSTGFLPHQLEGESRDIYLNLSVAELYRRQMAGPPVDPRRRNSGMSDAWAQVIYSWLEPGNSRTSNMKAAVVELAKAMPIDETLQDGLQIVEQYANELLRIEDASEPTIRTPAAVITTTPGSDTRYVFGERIGTGGMAEVYAGTQIGEQGFERDVAFKRVLTELQAEPGFADMLAAEARIASGLSHPNIVSVLNLRRDAQNRLFLVMERVRGKDLAAVLATGPLPHSLIIYVLVEALRGLAYAHGRFDHVSRTVGLVHRDISPENLLISSLGDVKINDFGLARAIDATGHARSQTLRGKPQYMSPEQVRGEELDNRSDLWAVGVILWEMLTNRPMLQGSSIEVMSWVLHKELVRPRVVRPEVPADLDAIAMKLLEREPARRYQRADEVIAALLGCPAAPRNGRDELAAALAARFAERDPSGRHNAAPSPPQPERATRPIARSPLTTASTPSTLDSAASETTAVPRPRTSRHLGVWLVPIVGAAATFVGARAFRERAEEPAAPAVVTASAQHRGDREPSSAPAMTVIDAGVIDAPARPATRIPDAPRSASAKLDAARSPAVAADAALRSTIPPSPTPPPLLPHIARASSPTGTPAAAGRSAPASVAGKGELVIVVTPWAVDVVLNGRQSGQTPFRQMVSAGSYVVTLVSPDMDKRETVSVTVAANKTTEIRRSW
jgi:serine/threonine-protein kinase